MSSKRGRKRNDNLPPNRARDVQRAFRARRAAHLQALEQRVTELEEENNCLRAALNLPPASRPPLGKGPTGKDKPRTFDNDLSHEQPLMSGSRTSSSPDSPVSTRTNSLSPSTITGSIRPSPRQAHLLDGASWDQSLLLGDEHQGDEHANSSTASTSYQLPPVTAPIPQKSPSQYPFPPANRMYMPPSHSSYPHATDRPMGGSYGSTSFNMRDVRDDPQAAPQQQYSFSSPVFPSPHESIHAHHSSRDGTSGHLPPYVHRRSITEPQGFRTIINQYPHLPNPTQLSQGIRLPSPPRLPDSGNGPQRPPAGYGPGDGRLNTMP